ncbi:helix-turn-helix domain-containing protein [Marinibaculum pumilum]|uniref:Helix-turn-helix domain-containing protein n=1 Tax=Marinibaculum pumilum TaxID=1766165 RepID=A0ABV7KVL4_9PROT
MTSRTDVVRPGDGFAHWHAATCRSYSVTECNAVPDRAFNARISLGAFGPLTISHISSTVAGGDPLRVVRTAGDIRKDGRDDFMFWLPMAGETAFRQDGRALRMRCGDTLLHDQAQPFVLQFGRHADAMMITVPRPLLLARLPEAPALVARPVAAASRCGALAADIMRDLLRLSEAAEDGLARRVGISALDILAATFEAELAGEAGAAQGDARLRQVQRFMLARLDDPALDLATIAAAQNMSPRSLTRLFARVGETPIRWLWRQRLATSYRMLAEGQARNVTEVALAHGFGDPSHFSRAFRRAYGRTPQSVRPVG